MKDSPPNIFKHVTSPSEEPTAGTMALWLDTRGRAHRETILDRRGHGRDQRDEHREGNTES